MGDSTLARTATAPVEVGNTEYDPTLGISGPIGTVRAQVEPVTYTARKSTSKG